MWVVIRGDINNDVHVIPQDDLICHTEEDCACGVAVEPVLRDDGSYGWLISHHSLDGREQNE